MQPDPLDDLINSLTALRALRGIDPVEGARRCPTLQDAAKAALRATRAAFVLEAGDPPHRLSPGVLAERLGVHPNKISEMRREALHAEQAQREETNHQPD